MAAMQMHDGMTYVARPRKDDSTATEIVGRPMRRCCARETESSIEKALMTQKTKPMQASIDE